MFGAIAGGIASALAGRSEERFSRNAETDLVCRLLLEKEYVDIIASYWFFSFIFILSFTLHLRHSLLHFFPYTTLFRSFMVWSNFTATKCRGLVSLNQVIKEIICLQPLK